MSEYSKEKLYFLKVHKDFFQGYKMRALEGVQGGKDYELMYLKLLCESVSHNGWLRFDENTPYTADMIAGITNTPIDTVRVGIKVLQRFDLVRVSDNDTIFLPEVPGMTTITTEGAERKKLQRQNNGGGQQADICPPREYRELRELDIKSVTTDSSKDSSSVPRSKKPVRTSKKQNALLKILIESGFIDEDELQDPQWEERLDSFVRERKEALGDKDGYVDAKKKVQFVISSISKTYFDGPDRNGKPIFKKAIDEEILETIANKFLWFDAALDKAVRQMEVELPRYYYPEDDDDGGEDQ